MRKIFQDYSLTGVVLVFLSFVLAIFFRFYELGSQSPWNDEIGTWFFVRHIDLVPILDNNTPLYYYGLKLFLGNTSSISSIRYFSASLSIFHLCLIFFLGRKVFEKQIFLLFWILLCLCPLDIAWSRMARHYGLLLEAVVLYWLWVRSKSPIWWLSLLSLLMGFVHVFSLIPMALILLIEKPKRFWIPILTSLGVVSYYLNLSSFQTRVGWNLKTNFSDFFYHLANQMLGESYPRQEFYSLGWAGIIFLFIVVGYFLIRRSKGGALFLLTFAFSLLAIELAMFFANYRVERYLVYLSGLLIIGFCDSVRNPKPLLTFILSIAFLIWQNPLKTYPWLRDWLEDFQWHLSQNPAAEVIICGNQFYGEYFQLEVTNCLLRLGTIDIKRSHIILDLDFQGRRISPYLATKMQGIILGPRIYLFEPLK